MLRIVRNLLAASRIFILIPVLASFVAAIVLSIYGAASVIDLTRSTFERIRDAQITAHEVEAVAIEFIALIDIFLLGTVLYIVALGLYELFIDDNLPLPQWLIITDLDDLKDKLISVVVVLLGVTFLGQAVSWDGDADILPLGLAIGSVVAAFGIFFALMRRGHRSAAGGAATDGTTAGEERH